MELTVTELITIGNSVGKGDRMAAIKSESLGTNMTLSRMRQVLQNELHAMMCRGELTLCSRAERRGEFPCPMHPMTEH